ncbi:MAG: PorV/PorQ family protein [Bacteroidia bacterium]
MKFPIRFYIMLTLLAWLGFDAAAQILPSFGDSRTGTTGMQFLKIAPDARSAGMAGSFTAVADDVSALYWNPAGLIHADSRTYALQFGHTQYFADINLNYAAATFTRNNVHYFGVSLISLSTPEMKVTTEFQPEGTGETFEAANLALALTFAQRLTDNFSFGLTGKYAYEGIAGISAHSGLFDFGFRYDLNLRNTRFAATVSNFGFNVDPEGEITLQTLNGPEVVDDFDKMAVPAIFRLGVATEAIQQEQWRIVISGQLNHPTDNNETFGIGSEFDFRQRLFARAGYEFGVDEAGIPAFGFGLKLQRRFGNIKVDYGFNNKVIIGTIHRITLGLGLR